MAESAASSENTTYQPSLGNMEDHVHLEKKPIPHLAVSCTPTGTTGTDEPLTSPREVDPNVFSRHNTIDLDDYFRGPRDIAKHSKWPMVLRMHGSIIPKLLIPLLFVAGWATLITVISQRVRYLGVDSVLLTVTGFVVSLGLSFRSSTAYERYAGGRQYWSQLVAASGVLGRVFWIHAKDQKGRDPRESAVRKINAMNLVVAFAHALKHRLRFEPYASHADLQNLIGHLNTFANQATEPGVQAAGRRKRVFKEAGQYLGVSFATSNPRKTIKRATDPLGNLPLELLSHLAVALDTMIANGQLEIALVQSQAYGALQTMHTVMVECDRVLNTPLPIAYSIAISQITWVYVLLLPFQLLPFLHWVAIPATISASYIILGLLMIGQEIENPFGSDVNDLPLDSYCDQIAADLDVIASYDKRPAADGFLMQGMPLYPVSTASAETWALRDEGRLHDAIKSKHGTTFQWRRGPVSASGKPVAGDQIV